MGAERFAIRPGKWRSYGAVQGDVSRNQDSAKRRSRSRPLVSRSAVGESFTACSKGLPWLAVNGVKPWTKGSRFLDPVTCCSGLGSAQGRCAVGATSARHLRIERVRWSVAVGVAPGSPRLKVCNSIGPV